MLKKTTIYIIVLFFIAAAPVMAKTAEFPFFAKYPNIDLSHWYLSHGWTNGQHQSCEWRAENVRGVDGKIQLVLSDNGKKIRKIGCGEISTKKRYHYGRYEARMRTAAGSGLNTAFFTYTGPPQGIPEHDEIDFEFLGKDPKVVEVNYHRNGKNMGPFKIDLGFDATAGFHDYAFEWMPDKIRWYADGKLIHETVEGADIPKNPGNILFSLWSGSDIPLTIKWLGKFKYNDTVTAEIEWVKFSPLDKLEKKQ